MASMPQQEDDRSAIAGGAVKSAGRVLEVLELLGNVRKPLSASEIGRLLEYPKSSTNVLLKYLTNLGYLPFDPDTMHYLPSLRVTSLGAWIPARCTVWAMPPRCCKRCTTSPARRSRSRCAPDRRCDSSAYCQAVSSSRSRWMRALSRRSSEPASARPSSRHAHRPKSNVWRNPRAAWRARGSSAKRSTERSRACRRCAAPAIP